MVDDASATTGGNTRKRLRNEFVRNDSESGHGPIHLSNRGWDGLGGLMVESRRAFIVANLFGAAIYNCHPEHVIYC